MDANAYRAIRERCAWTELKGRGKIRLTGEDRVRLLHAMCTNHIEQLQPGTGCYAFFLSAQGRILADAHIYCMPDFLLIDTEPEAKQRLMEHLDKYIIADDVTLHDFTDATGTIALQGPESPKVLESLGGMPAHAPCSIIEWDHSMLARWSYSAGPGYAILVPVEEKQKLIQELISAGVPEADLETADLVRMENGRPRYGADFSEAQIPQETQQMEAVHFSKGCYLGQEIVERVRSRGRVNRLLTSLEIAGTEAPARGAKVQADGKDAGEITSAVYSEHRGKVVAFGIVRVEALESPAGLSVNGAQALAVKHPEGMQSCRE